MFYNNGNGSTTFGIGDVRGRGTAGKDNIGGTPAGRLTSTHFGVVTGATGQVIGGVGGLESNTLTASQIPSITSVNASQSITVGEFGAAWQVPVTQASVIGSAPVPTSGGVNVPTSGNNDWKASELNGINSISVTSNNTGGTAHNNTQPTMILNKALFAGA